VEKVRQWKNNLPKNSDDIVFFYYSGHGYIDAPGIQWPQLNLFEKLTLGSRIMYQKIFFSGGNMQKDIRQLHNRLSIIFFDCCNGNEKDMDRYKLSHPLYKPVLRKKYSLPGLESLFLKTKGLITVSSASPHELSGCYPKTKPYGGFFTTGLLLSFIKCCKSSNVTWEQILDETNKYVASISDEGQHVLYTKE
jgi:hypothetical protein